MSNKFLVAMSVWLICYLLIMQLTDVFCQRQFSQKYYEADKTWSNCCPLPEDAMDSCFAESRSRCAIECLSLQWCNGFSYYAASRLCYFYSFVPSNTCGNSHCTFMMDRDAFSGPPEHGLEIAQLPIVNDWIVFLNRSDGSLDFYRTWSEYKNGFGDIGGGEFWLGNEKVHRLTNTSGANHTLRIEMYINGTWYYAEYTNFSIDSESNNYTLRLSGYSGNAGDSLTNTSYGSDYFHGGMSFSTWDSDNDRYAGGNCALTYGVGWWFSHCQLACLTCSYNGNFRWYTLSDLESSGNGRLRAARMMIKIK